jgi:hypothetical protein
MHLKQKLFTLCFFAMHLIACQNLNLRMENDREDDDADLLDVDIEALKDEAFNTDTNLPSDTICILNSYRLGKGEEPIGDSNKRAENLKVIDEMVALMISEIENKKGSIRFGRNELEMLKKEALRVRQALENGVVSLHELKEQVKNNINRIALGQNDVRNQKLICNNCKKITYVSRSQILYLDNAMWGGPWHFEDAPDVTYPTLADCYVARVNSSGAKAYSCVFCYKQSEISTRENAINRLEREKEVITSKMINKGEQINQKINETKKLKSITERIEAKRKSLKKMCEQDEKIANALEYLVKPYPAKEEYPDGLNYSDVCVIF